MPDRQAAAPQQLIGADPLTRRGHQSLAVTDPRPDRPPDAEPAPLEREEARVAGAIGEHRHPRPGPRASDRDGELRAHERIAQLPATRLQAMPRAELALAKLGRTHD